MERLRKSTAELCVLAPRLLGKIATGIAEMFSLMLSQMMGFPTGQSFKGTKEQKARLERQFIRKADFMTRYGTPIWNGEFGPVYADPRIETDAAEVNECRYNLLGEQLTIYDRYQIHWCIWLYKDIGVQGMVYTNPDSKWNKTIQPFLEKKRKYQIDAWGKYPSKEAEDVLNPLVAWIDKVSPTAKETYPTPWATERHVLRNVFQTFLASSFSEEFASLFKDMDKSELDAVAHSFHFDECLQRDGLNKALQSHAAPKGERIKLAKYQAEKGGDSHDTLP